MSLHVQVESTIDCDSVDRYSECRQCKSEWHLSGILKWHFRPSGISDRVAFEWHLEVAFSGDHRTIARVRGADRARVAPRHAGWARVRRAAPRHTQQVSSNAHRVAHGRRLAR